MRLFIGSVLSESKEVNVVLRKKNKKRRNFMFRRQKYVRLRHFRLPRGLCRQGSLRKEGVLVIHSVADADFHWICTVSGFKKVNVVLKYVTKFNCLKISMSFLKA